MILCREIFVLTKEMISRNIFLVRMNFTFWCVSLIHSPKKILSQINSLVTSYTLGLESVSTPTPLSKREELCFVFVQAKAKGRDLKYFQSKGLKIHF